MTYTDRESAWYAEDKHKILAGVLNHPVLAEALDLVRLKHEPTPVLETQANPVLATARHHMQTGVFEALRDLSRLARAKADAHPELPHFADLEREPS